MDEQQLIEALAAQEHARWSKWMTYLLSKCEPVLTVEHPQGDGSLRIPAELVKHWQWEIETSYADLPERYKQSDRNQVVKVLPIIRAYVEASTHGQEQATVYGRRARSLRAQSSNLTDHTMPIVIDPFVPSIPVARSLILFVEYSESNTVLRR